MADRVAGAGVPHERPTFTCPFCHRVFPRKKSLKVHCQEGRCPNLQRDDAPRQRLRRTLPAKTSCSSCGGSFSRREYLKHVFPGAFCKACESPADGQRCSAHAPLSACALARAEKEAGVTVQAESFPRREYPSHTQLPLSPPLSPPLSLVLLCPAPRLRGYFAVPSFFLSSSTLLASILEPFGPSLLEVLVGDDQLLYCPFGCSLPFTSHATVRRHCQQYHSDNPLCSTFTFQKSSVEKNESLSS